MAVPENGDPHAPVGDALIYRILTAVAAAEGVDPISLDPPLTRVIDPDKIERLLERTDGWVRVEFTYHGWHIVVCSDGSINLAPALY